MPSDANCNIFRNRPFFSVEAFLENTFLLYHVPEEKIRQAIEFVSQFDYPTIAQNMIDTMLRELEVMTA